MTRISSISIAVLMILAISFSAPWAISQETEKRDLSGAYKALNDFILDGGYARVENLKLKRDRVEMTFTGTFYFSKPVLGKMTGAVFIGEGWFHADTPPSTFEEENLRNMLKTDVLESDFRTAVLRFTDDSFSIIGQSHQSNGRAEKDAQDLGSEIGPRFARETGANLASRILVSLVNSENPGVFIAQFDKGRRNRFTYVLDMQCRIPTVNFTVNGGEKGLIFAFNRALSANDIWLAFYSENDYEAKTVSYSDVFDQVETQQYDMKVDLRDPGKVLKVNAKMDLRALSPIQAVSFALTEGLPEKFSYRKNKGMRITRATLSDGTELQTIQEEWEGGFTVLLPALRKARESFMLDLAVEGDFIYDLDSTDDCHYPFINGEWYPRHGYLARSKYAISFIHDKKYKVASSGERVKEEPVEGNADEIVTSYRITEPVALVTFAMGPYQLHQEQRKLQRGELSMEFFSLPGSVLTLKEEFVLAEMGNATDFLSVMFGAYPYSVFRGVYHPFRFGQGFATMLALPAADRESHYTYAFLSHETAHQWWGNLVAWRSYRDQWLSEGFAEYSGILYVKNRTQNDGKVRDLLNELRDSLKLPTETDGGRGTQKVFEVGPMVLGHRLNTRESLNAYSILTYNKGALVLRMLHYLFTDPKTGSGQAFFDMMKDFVDRHRNSAASTEQFAAVAGEHYARTPIAQKYGQKDLNWFFSQWIWQTALPSYRLEYSLINNADQTVMIQGTVFQEDAPENWGMILPLVINFSGDQVAYATVVAIGAETPVKIGLPRKPSSVELDPDRWILSDKTSTKKK